MYNKLKKGVIHSYWKIEVADIYGSNPDHHKASSRLNEEDSDDLKTEERKDNHEAEGNVQTEDFCGHRTKNKMNDSEDRSFKRINRITKTKNVGINDPVTWPKNIAD